MKLLWLRIRWRTRALLGIRDVRQFTLRQRIEEQEARRGRTRREEARDRRRLAFRLTGWALIFASLAVVAWVAVTS
ncbi:MULTISPECIES: hypothetical protein [Streptomyces]|uniref:hypothetical protein n=1 Tax=Streptomyces TaxID=1883 RepID=UPI00167C44C3|nr:MULTISPECIES: hypothetical protein [Streptomyces]MBK3524846.1 hypothetical protein [Streptomyces sp. MBT70]GGR70963.1 hypothetical protein GCM10010236_26530 [Streptomyces eurythermus]